MKLIIDRYEGRYAVCEKDDQEMVNIQILNLPINSKVGDILNIENDEILSDIKSTNDRKKYIEKITKDLWEN